MRLYCWMKEEIFSWNNYWNSILSYSFWKLLKKTMNIEQNVSCFEEWLHWICAISTSKEMIQQHNSSFQHQLTPFWRIESEERQKTRSIFNGNVSNFMPSIFRYSLIFFTSQYDIFHWNQPSEFLKAKSMGAWHSFSLAL